MAQYKNDGTSKMLINQIETPKYRGYHANQEIKVSGSIKTGRGGLGRGPYPNRNAEPKKCWRVTMHIFVKYVNLIIRVVSIIYVGTNGNVPTVYKSGFFPPPGCGFFSGCGWA